MLLRYIAARGGLLSMAFDLINVQDLYIGDVFVRGEMYCSWSSKIAYLLEAFRTLSVMTWRLWRLYCNIAIVCVV